MAHNLVLMTLTLKSTRTLAVFILRLVAKLYSENAAPYKFFVYSKTMPPAEPISYRDGRRVSKIQPSYWIICSEWLPQPQP